MLDIDMPTSYTSKSYRCAERSSFQKCPATLVENENGEHVIGEHNHGRRTDQAARRNVMKREVHRLATTTNIQPDEIIKQASDTYPDVAIEMSVDSLRSMIKRVRHRFRPRIPETVIDLGEVLNGFLPAQGMYRGRVETVTRENGENVTRSSLIFLDNSLLDLLNNATKLHMDGTFKVVPQRPAMSQLWIVYVRYMDEAFPVVYVLCENRRIIQLCPNLVQNVESVFTDFERAAVGSVRAVFLRARIRGCWFHFCKAVTTKWKALRMVDPPKLPLYLPWALAMLPAEHFAEGAQVITRVCDPLAAVNPELLAFCHYLRRQWVPIANVVSVHGSPIRTNISITSVGYFTENKSM